MQDLGDDDNVSAFDDGAGGGGEQSSMGDGAAPRARPHFPARRARPARAATYEVQPQAAIHSGSTPAGEIFFRCHTLPLRIPIMLLGQVTVIDIVSFPKTSFHSTLLHWRSTDRR